MFSSKVLKTAVLALGVASTCFSASFQDAYTQLRSTQQYKKSPLDLESVLKPLETYKDDRGNEFVAFRKEVNGVPVYGQKKLVVFPKTGFNSLWLSPLKTLSSGETTELLSISEKESEPVLTLERAFVVSIRNLREDELLLHEALPPHLARAGELVYYADLENEYHLAFHVVLPGLHEGLKTSYDFFIDARNGEIINRIRNLYDLEGKGVDLTEGKLHSFPVEKPGEKFTLRDSDRDLNVYNGKKGNFSSDSDALWDTEGETRGKNQKAEVELYLNMARTIDYFKSNYNFVWKEGDDAVHATAHVGRNFNNAYFSPWQGGFFFGDGSGTAKGFDYLTKGLDVAAHEFTHGVINILSPLSYSGETGALNEHIADFFGAMVDDDDWQMGDNITIGDNPALRNMKDPTRGHGDLLNGSIKYSKWKKLKKKHDLRARIYPDRISRKIRCTARQDNGGVHLNSSIFNKFAYLATTGNEINSKGLGRRLLADVYMRLMQDKYLSRGADFEEFMEQFMAAAAVELEDNEEKEVYLSTLQQAFERIKL
jgi:bacillolysin